MKYQDGIALYETWKGWLDTQLANSTGPCADLQPPIPAMFSGRFAYFFIQEAMVSEAFQGLAISLSLAFVVLVLATGNIVVGSLATLTICSVVASVVGMMVMMGWKLGILENINLVLTPGTCTFLPLTIPLLMLFLYVTLQA